jgi:hypothetical protein
MIASGRDAYGNPRERRWFIIALNGDLPQSPCAPAIVLARKLAARQMPGAGAVLCAGRVTLEECLAEMMPHVIRTYES